MINISNRVERTLCDKKNMKKKKEKEKYYEIIPSSLSNLFNKIKFLPLEKSALELAEKEKVNHEGERNQ